MIFILAIPVVKAVSKSFAIDNFTVTRINAFTCPHTHVIVSLNSHDYIGVNFVKTNSPHVKNFATNINGIES